MDGKLQLCILALYCTVVVSIAYIFLDAVIQFVPLDS